MPRFSLLLAVAFFGALASMSAAAVELSALHLPMTRSEADASLSKDYEFRVLEDITVRRTWKEGNRVVSVDFSPSEGDEALMIYIDYTKPVTATLADRDAALMLQVQPGAWTPLKPHRAERMGMTKGAEGMKLAGGRYCFRELDQRGRVTRLTYSTSMPEKARWELADDKRYHGASLMGVRAGVLNTEFLWKDEERRRDGAKRLPGQLSAEVTSAGATVDAGGDVADEEMLPRPSQPGDVAEGVKTWLSGVDSGYYALAGAVVMLLLLIRNVRKAREEKRRRMMADYIINRGRKTDE